MQRELRKGIAAGFLLAFLATTAAAQPIEDPDWPCIQRKVPELSVGQMWAEPLPPDNWRDDDAARDVAARIAPRRIDMPEVEETAAAYAATLPPEERAEKLATVFAAVLSRINAERGQVIGGISRYAHHQTDLARRISEREDELAKLHAIPEDQRDLDKLEELQDAQTWDTRIYRDRAQSLTYVCETPVLLEQRAFAIARTLQTLE